MRTARTAHPIEYSCLFIYTCALSVGQSAFCRPAPRARAHTRRRAASEFRRTTLRSFRARDAVVSHINRSAGRQRAQSSSCGAGGLTYLTGVCPSERNKLRGTASRSRAAFSCNEPTGRLVELIKAHRTTSSDFSEASPAGFYSRSPAAHHWSPRRCGVPPNLTESSSPSRVQTTPSVNKWSAASRRSALV